MRGAKPKPTHLKVIAGNPGKRKLNAHEPKPTAPLAGPPAWLTPSQLATWNTVVADAPLGLLTALDAKTLLVYVIATDLHAQAVQEVASAGMMVTTNSGDLMQNPHMAVINRQAVILLKAAAEMGLTPSARSRVAIEPAAATDDAWAGF
jgi:P27 family predicted phage terminase small subunit